MASRMASAARHAHRHADDEPIEPLDEAQPHSGAMDTAVVEPVEPDADDDVGSHGSNVRVVVRIRPLLESELSANHECSLIHVGGEKVHMDDPQPVPAAASIQVQSKDNVHRFAFDAVLGPQATQAELFRAGGVDHMLTQLLKGYHGTIFAYGQTGSGKTHTMDGISYSTKQVVVPAGVPVTIDGEPGANVKSKMVRVIKEPSVEDSGLSLRCINELFAMIAAKQNAGDYASNGAPSQQQTQYTVKCSFIQIYQESVFDLLTDAAPLYVSSSSGGGGLSQKSAAAAGLRIRWSQSKDFYVENLYIFECKSAKEARNYFLNGMKKRLVASHKMNASSSRSHCIFTIYLEQKPANDPEQIITSKLSLVDLAGSERVALTGATGNVLQQSIGINKSLFVLRKVIKSLAKLGSATAAGGSPGGKVVHPYRDSTLTRLLKHSLGGNSITIMIACISPSDAYIDENLSTLNYAGLTKNIANNVHINEDPKTALIRKLRAEIKMLRGLLAKANQSFSIGGGAGVGQQQLMPAMSSSSYLSPSARNGSVSSRSHSFSQQQSSQQALLSPSSSAVVAAADPTLSQKIIESVGIIKTLLADNAELRGLYDSHASQVESLEFSNVTLSAENNELRERIHFLESVITEGHAAEQDIMRSPAAASAAAAAAAALEEIVVADDDGGDSGSISQSQRDMAFEMEALREENQRLKGLMIASDFGSSSGSYSSNNGSRTARGAQQQQQPPQRTHSALGHHASSSSQQPQYVLNQSAHYSAAPAYPPSSSSSSAAPASRQGVYSSSSSASSSNARSLNEGTSHPSTVYRPNSSQLQTLTSLQGRRGRSNSGATAAAKKSAGPSSRASSQQLQQQQQASPSHFSAAQQEWERQRLLELDRDRFGSESPPPSATATAARHTHAWDPRPAGAQPFSNVAKAASAVLRQPTNGGGGGNSSLLQAALSAQPVSLQLGAPSYQREPPNLMHSASLNPAIVAYMQQMQSQNTGRGSNSSQSRARY